MAVMATTPDFDPGSRTEPPDSSAMPQTAKLVLTAVADPVLELPLSRSVAQGLHI